MNPEELQREVLNELRWEPSVNAAEIGVTPGEVAIAWVLTLLTFGYLLPWAIAATRGGGSA